jgi:hypothetical protein
MPSTPPRAVAVEAAASQPTDADNAAISRLSQAAGRDLPPVAYLVKIQLETVPEATSSGWALYVGNFRIPKYWEYKDGIYFKVYDPQFFRDHSGGALRFSPDGTEFIETGLVLTSPEILPSAVTDTPELPQQRDILG